MADRGACAQRQRRHLDLADVIADRADDRCSHLLGPSRANATRQLHARVGVHPASLTKPGRTSETPTAVRANRHAGREKIRRSPNFVAQ